MRSFHKNLAKQKLTKNFGIFGGTFSAAYIAFAIYMLNKSPINFWWIVLGWGVILALSGFIVRIFTYPLRKPSFLNNK